MRHKLIECMIGCSLLLGLANCQGETTAWLPFAEATSVSTSLSISANALVITGGLVIDGVGSDPIPEGTVVIQENRIMAIGRAVDFAIPSEGKVIDAKGGTILPGIINAHVHNTSDPARRRFYFLLKGVTATCDLAAPLDSMSQFTQDDTTGPSARGFRAGPIITAPGGHPDPFRRARGLSYEVTNPDEARAAVVDLVNRGVDVIKIALEPGYEIASWPMLNMQEVKAIVEEAHARGRLVRAHVTRADTLEIALASGVDVIEHVPVPQLSGVEWQIAAQDKDLFKFPNAYEAQLVRMVKLGVVMVPTLSVTPNVYDWYEVPLEYKHLTYKLFLEPVRRFHAMGGIVALGNDYGNPGAESGMPLSEMRQLLLAGLTPMEVIQAGTRYAAMVCGKGDVLGTLQPGKLADVIVVDGNPLTDIEAMSRVIVVIKDGEVVFLQK